MMVSVARYSPSLAPAAWLRWAFSGRAAAARARDENLSLLGPGREARELENGRQALLVWLQSVRRTCSAGEVLVPAQICSVVPESIRRAGFTPRFVDGDGVYPTPSPAQYASALSSATAAIIVAPLYGYLQNAWRPLLDAAGETPIALDLAQGLGLLDVIDVDLLERADALVYSFGLGKGLDAGGGLLLTRAKGVRAMSQPGDPISGQATGRGEMLGVLARALAVRGAEASGAYRLLVGRMEDASEEAKESEESFVPRTIPPAIHLLWRGKIETFLEEMLVARQRAAALAPLAGVTHDLDAFTTARSAPLRQIVRLKNPAMRDRAVTELRRAGVDCAPAGEPLPAHAEERYPNAFAFGADAIRLPFLGRLSEREFAFVRRTLESILVDLPH